MKTRFFLLIYIPVLLIVSTIGIWFFEYVLTGNPDSAFNNLFSSLWWTVQTVTTLGYGAHTPITLGGQLFSILLVAAGWVRQHRSKERADCTNDYQAACLKENEWVYREL